MKQITSDYFELIEELNEKILEDDFIEILNLFDKINLFWNKNKKILMHKILNLREEPAIIGGITYPHFDENYHFIPIANNKLLIIDDPISKMDLIIREEELNKLQNVLSILRRTVDMLLESKEIILKNNIVIVPLRLYYGIDNKNLHKLSDKMVFSILNYMFDVEIQNNKDIEMLSNKYDNFDKIDELISGTKKDILFLGSELKKFSISKRIEKYCKNAGMNFDYLLKNSSPIMLIVMSIYGYSAQLSDIINTCEYINSDLYLFIEIPTFYFNILLENIYSSDEKLYNKYLKTIISFYLQKYLEYTDFNKFTIDDFCFYYKNMNLLEVIKADYINNNHNKTITNMALIKKYVEKRVKEFYNQSIKIKEQN